jgi:hypothetical protein
MSDIPIRLKTKLTWSLHLSLTVFLGALRILTTGQVTPHIMDREPITMAKVFAIKTSIAAFRNTLEERAYSPLATVSCQGTRRSLKLPESSFHALGALVKSSSLGHLEVGREFHATEGEWRLM